METWDVRQKKPESGELISHSKTKTKPESEESGSNKHAIQREKYAQGEPAVAERLGYGDREMGGRKLQFL